MVPRNVLGMATVTFVDETTSGDRGAAFGLEIAEERLTARELIRRRVFQEVAEFNARTEPQLFQGLVQPQDTERVLNGYALRTPRRIDPEAQAERALAAFAGNGFLVLVGDRQVTDPDEEIELPLGVEVTFLKLVPLVGG
ncbi:hypothetical protein GCM10010385_17090 [Streptomyces geysiriensis]|nr:hypothetical protein GCM10010385_17090 [Streptomyces geysiriensis]GGZ62944.1 hypothetical protein GCM10010301_39850 [Streptomyces plicatus]GHC05890.1 hypothetical protein GCM10010308_18660 [Streptomyces vinaceusdrappus]